MVHQARGRSDEQLAVIIAAVSASASDFDAVSASAFSIGRTAVLVVAGITLLLAVAAMTTKPARLEAPSRVHRATFVVAGTIGSARVAFGLLFAVSAAATFADDVASLVIVYLFAIVVLEERLPERLLGPIVSARGQEVSSAAVVERVVEPRTVVARFPDSASCRIGATVRQTPDGDAIGVITYMSSASEQALVEISLTDSVVLSAGRSLVCDLESHEGPVLGSVTSGTQLERVVIRAAPQHADDLEVREGSLVTTRIRGDEVLYQVVAGRVEHGSPEGPAESSKLAVVARKLGRWDDAESRFEPVEWVPQPGSPVSLTTVGPAPAVDERFVGTVPQSPYGVVFDPDAGITHNTAVFGILGSGKTTLASELVWRTIGEGAKAVVLDITNQWAEHFRELDAAAVQAAFEQRVAEAIDGRVADRAVDGEEAGNVAAFRRVIREALGDFLSGDDRLLIVNPARLRVTQELGFLRNARAEVLRGLTPAEVTACFAVALLDLVANEERDHVHAALVLEEAHTLAPEWNSVAHDKEKQATTATARAVLQGRKYGLGCLVVTQRTANVTKTILNQCNTIFALRVYDQTGAEFLSHFIGSDYASLLANLQDRRAVVFGRGSSCRSPVVIEVNDSAALADWRASIASRTTAPAG